MNGNKEYTFSFDLEAIREKPTVFKIYIKELDKNEITLKQTEIEIREMDGILPYTIKTQKDTTNITLLFKCSKPTNNTKLTIRSIKLNDKEIRVNYKIIPISLVNRIEKIKINTASSNTREEYIKYSFDLIKQSPIFGLGGYAWRCSNMDNFELKTVAEHCYPLQLFTQNGVLSVLTYLAIVVLLIIRFIRMIKNKEKDIYLISFFMIAFLIILHSLLDFDMYFQIILLYLFISFAVINDDKTNQINREKIYFIIYAILLVVILYFSIGEAISINIDNSKIEDTRKRLDTINLQIVFLPYNNQLYEEKLELLDEMVYYGDDLLNIDVNKEIDECINYLQNIEKNN